MYSEPVIAKIFYLSDAKYFIDLKIIVLLPLKQNSVSG